MQLDVNDHFVDVVAGCLSTHLTDFCLDSMHLGLLTY
jgi:hypothetical protein